MMNLTIAMELPERVRHLDYCQKDTKYIKADWVYIMLVK